MAKEVDPKFTKPYDPAGTEGRIYEAWEKSGYFNPDNLPGERTEPFSVVLPPVNVTGVLHLGHAYEDSLQDAVIRYARMRGKRALFVPGTDSAAIATQARVEKNIQKEEGKSRHDLGREELVRRITAFAKESESTILNQIRRMGASLDWSRYAYALDKARSRAVTEAFTRMYKAGLIYRGYRIVNWDPKGQTTISDDEIVYEERPGKLYTFKYSKDFPISIATTRPETKAGDVAVAVHPEDPRYQPFLGKEYDTVFCDVPVHLKIVADAAVDPSFGTGAVGVTPAHSQIDWEIARRHALPTDNVVINEYAKMKVEGRLNGLKAAEARAAVVDWLQSQGLLEKEEDVLQNIATAERTGAVIEPLPKMQWWVDVEKPFTLAHSSIPGIPAGAPITLKQLMRKAVESGAVAMPQEGFRNAYFHWIDNLRDWCISRQIWFGHRIPVWYRGEEIRVGEAPEDSATWLQDPDVLDTWFSSALWTFSTLGWPDHTLDLGTYHPTAFMSPGYEILTLWVSRMILMAGFHLGQVPFKTVLIHGLVRDKSGRKFSKSQGNGIDPLEMIDKYGADALRMGLLVGTAVGNDIKFDEQKVKGYKHFANKLWNIARFILESAPDLPAAASRESAPGRSAKSYYPSTLLPVDQELADELDSLLADVTKDLEESRFYLAAEKLYHYAWHRLADEILEESKQILGTKVAPSSAPEAGKASRQAFLLYALDALVKALHPFMPFLTEEIYQSLPTKNAEFLMISHWPV
ncbi:MAG TPA: valine--tRNA ligase [Candidatus Paceibacterota bacterium]|nr:valine--tRNA ligase [Candidatus Paceibacterota bacterium]